MPHAVILQTETDAQTAKVYQAALLGVVVWDWLVSLRSEYKFIWKGGPSVLKALYIVARYVCLILTAIVFAIQFVQLPLSQCDAFVRANCMALTVVQVTSISVLTQRVWAIFLSHKWRYCVLIALLVLDAATLAFGVVHAIIAVTASPAPMVDGVGFCQVQVHSSWMGFTGVFFGMPILAHTIATAAVAYAVSPLPNTNAVKRLLLVDGVLYLFAVNSIGILQLIFFFQTANESLRMLNSAALLSLTAVFCCRFMLHLREEAEEINRHPFGRSPKSSGMSEFSSSSASNEKGSKRSFLRRMSGKPSSAGSRDAGTVTVASKPDTLVGNSPSKFVVPLNYITVEHSVEQQVERMTDMEKEYSGHDLKGRDKKCSYDDDEEQTHSGM